MRIMKHIKNLGMILAVIAALIFTLGLLYSVNFLAIDTLLIHPGWYDPPEKLIALGLMFLIDGFVLIGVGDLFGELATKEDTP